MLPLQFVHYQYFYFFLKNNAILIISVSDHSCFIFNVYWFTLCKYLTYFCDIKMLTKRSFTNIYLSEPYFLF